MHIILPLLYILSFFPSFTSQNIYFNKHEQVHLSLLDGPHNIAVSWVTFYDLRKLQRKPTVKYGTATGTGQKKTGFTRILKVAKSTITRYFHTVVLKNLEANQRYYYKVGDGETWSKIFTFKTFPYGSNYGVKICIFGDLDTGVMYTVEKLRIAVERDICQMIIHVGDIAYNLQGKQGTIGDDFMRTIEPIAAHVPYMVINGNHEFDCHGYSHYENRFEMPTGKYKTDHFYAFNVGLVNFVALSSEAYGFYIYNGPLSIKRQAQWLYVTLERNKMYKNKRPWTISYLHRPLYCLQKTTEGECYEHESLTLRRGFKDIPGLEDYFFSYGVDLVFSGHEHGYQRNYPTYNRTVFKHPIHHYHNPAAPIYILSGAAGCTKCSKLPVLENIRNHPFAATRSLEYGYTHVHVINYTHIRITQMNTQTDKIVDQFWITKEIGHEMPRHYKMYRHLGEYKSYNGPYRHSYLTLSKGNDYCNRYFNVPIYNYNG
ncbi:Iron/zinc purple acid phosphatase-like protein [Strongyloides ratti]|uniref:Purple acid phosphatase n=1 Tax=Strongyloides ratti TaxID=34506 RepID=A0A090LQY9_STRRB|nr:Iron/zinc purple acid phosphatase-like protein [Strongyloides ratti]CEF70596.1 Iron/zinc purple acid phosphatase-like protein [Strongyloides ratti]